RHEEEGKLEARFLKDMIDGIVEELPDKCRLVFHYSRNLGLKNEEIAARTGITKKTVENTLNRALRIIRGKLRNHGIPLLTIAQILLLRKIFLPVGCSTLFMSLYINVRYERSLRCNIRSG
ncbi:sigma factor-like helix-turn-helix DNA-binding protein, partial [Chitinophaga pinensis]|uniref:sigma factor-like helix-turn-helix DNA-binding protein n=1 Tax=Chitinophaga pinensis TaxID=79329 RepID=UPI0028F6F474